MKKTIFFLAMVLLAAATVAGTSGNASAATCNGTFTGLTPNLTNGQSLVAANGNCSSCHSKPTGASASTIYSFASHMSFMSIWTCQNFVDVAAALAPAPATCTSFTYSAWGACQSNGTQTRTVVSSSPSGCTGGTPVLSQTCTYVPPACTSFTYSGWGTCQSNNTQTRTVVSSSPSGCTGGTPVLSQTCTFVPPACTGYTYTLGACQPNNTAPVTSSIGIPAGCSGGVTPATTQSCTYTAPTCTSFTYGAWGACQSNGTQTRTVMSSSPAGCSGGMMPITSQSCTFMPGAVLMPPATSGLYWDDANKRMGVGVSSPQFAFDVSALGASESQMHFSSNGSMVGGWLTSLLDNNFFISSGAYYDQVAGGWIQASPDGNSVMSGSGGAGYRVFLQTGCTVGQVCPASEKLRVDYNGNVGIGTTTATQKLEVNGGMRLNTTATQPVCGLNVRGTFWVVQGASGDTVEVCINSGGTYAWRTIAN